MVSSAIWIAAAILAVSLHSSDAHAHALAQRYDLPLPLGFFLVAAGAAVAVSFVILALFGRHDVWDDKRAKDRGVHGTIPGVIVALCRTIGVVLLTLIVVAGLFGTQSTFKNIVPVSVWVIWWVGFSFLCAFVGNVWLLINPWTALFDLAERLASDLW